MDTREILLYIVLPIAVVLTVLSIVLFVLFVIHSLKRKLRKCKTSFKVLCKDYFKALNLIPSLLQSINLNDELRDSFDELYKTYKSKENEKIEELRDLGSLEGLPESDQMTLF